MSEQHDAQLDEMIERVKSKLQEREDKKLVGFWIPESDKAVFDKVQKLTKGEFGKEIQAIISRACRRVKLDELEACG